MRIQPTKRKTKGKSGSKGHFSSICHLTGKNEPLKLTQGTSGTGCLTSQNTGPSITNGSNLLITPFAIGSRSALFAALFAQWKVRRIQIQYCPDATGSGVVNSASGPTSSPSYGSRQVAMSWNKDPDIQPSTHFAIIETGGVAFNSARSSRLTFPSSGWLWTSTTTAYAATGIDLRMCSHGVFNAAFIDASTTASATYGRFIFTYDLSFRYPQNVSVIGDPKRSLSWDFADVSDEKSSTSSLPLSK